jgi:hypothetical protein
MNCGCGPLLRTRTDALELRTSDYRIVLNSFFRMRHGPGGFRVWCLTPVLIWYLLATSIHLMNIHLRFPLPLVVHRLRWFADAIWSPHGSGHLRAVPLYQREPLVGSGDASLRRTNVHFRIEKKPGRKRAKLPGGAIALLRHATSLL